MSTLSKLFTNKQRQEIVDAILHAEKSTSAEIRVHFENHCKEILMDRAVSVFNKLKMDKTKDRNGVLIYVAIKDRLTAIIGDININKHVDKVFWNDCYLEMSEYFKKGDFTKGVCTAIQLLEIELKNRFPYQKDDVDELSNDISFGQ